jgi:hypothetical protein
MKRRSIHTCLAAPLLATLALATSVRAQIYLSLVAEADATAHSVRFKIK